MLSSPLSQFYKQGLGTADISSGLGGTDILTNGGLGSFLGGLSNLFSAWGKKKAAATPTAAPVAEPQAPAIVAPKPWESGVNSTYSNPFGASPDATTFASMLSRQPTL